MDHNCFERAAREALVAGFLLDRDIQVLIDEAGETGTAPLRDRTATLDRVSPAVACHVRESDRIGLKVLMAAGGHLHAIPICLKGALGEDSLDDALNVHGLTSPRI